METSKKSFFDIVESDKVESLVESVKSNSLPAMTLEKVSTNLLIEII